MKKITYDFGSNNGDNIPYYLLKSDLVIAVEANPTLCDHIKNRFKEQILNGSLIVENCILNVGESQDSASFYIHKTNNVLSQLPKPNNVEQFEEISLPSQNVIELIQKFGDPYYIKIDIEHYDQIILRELFVNGIKPPFISSESHKIEVFALLVALGQYKSFKLVDGSSISTKYKDFDIETINGKIKYSFPHHSAGPFGNDISGPWMTSDNFFRVLSFAGLGWKDIHATSTEIADASYAPKPQFNISINF